MDSHSIVSCECGAQLRLPKDRGNRNFRCPACKSVLAMTLDTKVLSSTLAGEGGSTCPICQSTIEAQEPVVNCPACDLIHHRDCWSEIGGCGTYGCTQAPEAIKPETRAPTTAWGDSKECPMCGESIKSISLRCRYCGTKFDTADPLTRDELLRRRSRQQEQNSLRVVTIALFLFSLLGLTGPLVGLIGSAYLMPKGEQLRKCGALYLILAWCSLIVSGLFTVLIAVFVICEWMGFGSA